MPLTKATAGACRPLPLPPEQAPPNAKLPNMTSVSNSPAQPSAAPPTQDVKLRAKLTGTADHANKRHAVFKPTLSGLTRQSPLAHKSRPALVPLRMPGDQPDTDQLTSLPTIDSNESLKQLNESSQGPSGSGKPYINTLGSNRFRDIPTAARTMVTAPDGVALPANRVAVNGKNLAIACQYPTDNYMYSHLAMLLDNRTPVLTVLASDQEIAGKLPAYFKEGSHRYGDISVTAEKRTDNALPKQLPNGCKIAHYLLNISGPNAKISVPVVHVEDWPDRQALDLESSLELNQIIGSIADSSRTMYAKAKSRAIDDPNKMLPVIHCRAGVGRTGQQLAMQAMRENPDLALEDVIQDLRSSRNHFMVQTQAQMQVLQQFDRQHRSKQAARA